MRLDGKRVVVTGGGGFLGSFIVESLREAGYQELYIPRRCDYDLRRAEDIERLFRDSRPEVLIHAAAVVGGIAANQAHPGRFFFENAMMGMQLIEAARIHNLAKIIVLGTVCAYPKFTAVPFREDDLWNGYPEETNAPYGIAKKALLVQCQAYRREYGLNAIFLLPVNLYGPRDNFDRETSHVVPAMIRKFVEAQETGQAEVLLWGDGSPTREFLYVKDAAAGIVAATAYYDGAEPVNLGSGQEISIRDLAIKIAALTGFDGRIVWDTSRPNGQPHRSLDTTRAEQEFGFRALTPFDQGLKETIAWYLNSRPVATSTTTVQFE